MFSRVLVALYFGILLGGTSFADKSKCPGEPYYLHSGDYIEIFFCDKDQSKLLEKIERPGAAPTIFEVPITSGSTIIVLNNVMNLVADTKSVKVTLYDTRSGKKVLGGYSKNVAFPSDVNSDGVPEIILFEDIFKFDSLLLSRTGWPTIVELGDPITLGTIDDYENVRSQLLKTSIETRRRLEEACVFDGLRDPMCAAIPDIERLGLFIDLLRIEQ